MFIRGVFWEIPPELSPSFGARGCWSPHIDHIEEFGQEAPHLGTALERPALRR